MKLLIASLCALTVCSCASKQQALVDEEGLMSEPGMELALQDGLESEAIKLCQPQIVDQRAVLSSNCLNRIEGVHTYGRQLNPIGRENKEPRSLCENMWLPRCRHKY